MRRRVFLGIGPSSTWISFQKSFNFHVIGRGKQENRTQMSGYQKQGIMGLFLAHLQEMPWDLHLLTNYKNTVVRDKTKEKSCEVVLYSEVQPASKLWCPSSSINVASALFRGSLSFGL